MVDVLQSPDIRWRAIAHYWPVRTEKGLLKVFELIRPEALPFQVISGNPGFAMPRC